MTPERHQQIKRLFLAAVELAPQEAESFLDEACSGDQALRDEVQSLLAHHAEETLLPQGNREVTATQAVADLPTAGPLIGLWPDDTGEILADRAPGTLLAGRY